MKLQSLYLLAGLTVLTTITAGAPGDFSVSGREILNNLEDFEVKGICYQPAAIGENPSAGYPYGDYFWVGSDYQARWARDFENFRKMGNNVIRVYGWDLAQNHSAFLSAAYNGGEQSLYVLINRYINPGENFADANPDPDYDPPSYVAQQIADWQAIATEVANNPGVMGFLIGNEANNSPGPGFWEAMNAIAGAVKAIAPNKLVSVAITDRLDQVSNEDSTMTNLDFWALQLYRGSSFNAFPSQYSDVSNKPVIITEFGYDALDGRTDTEWPNNAELPANAIEGLLNELRTDEAGADIVAGVCVFEYADEWWKDSAGNSSLQEFGPRWPGSFEDGQGNEEWWGIFRVLDNGSQPDILQPRALFYRLAAMWNAPYQLTPQSSLVNQNLQVSFSYPIHLRDQRVEVEMSSDMASWTKIADNASSTYLASVDPNVSVINTLVGENMDVSVLYGGLPNLLTNGDFESGTTSGWSAGGSISTSPTQDGSYALNLTSSVGGFSVPAVEQTFPASPGDEFNLSGYMLRNAPLPTGATFGLFKIVFRDIVGIDLEPASVSAGQFGPGNNPGAESLPFLNANSPVNTWIFSEAQAIAPSDTVSVSFYALNVDESASTMYFDSIEAIDTNAAPASGPSIPRIFFRIQSLGR